MYYHTYHDIGRLLRFFLHYSANRVVPRFQHELADALAFSEYVYLNDIQTNQIDEFVRYLQKKGAELKATDEEEIIQEEEEEEEEEAKEGVEWEEEMKAEEEEELEAEGGGGGGGAGGRGGRDEGRGEEELEAERR